MCGIIGYKGRKRASRVLLRAIKKLEYRGYDSVGMAVINNSELELRKEAGKIDEVDGKLNFLELNGNLGIAHTRWSTHGIPNKENAHPHLSNDKSIAVVHNGIIENYEELREELGKLGYKFNSETDTEVIPILIEKNCKEYEFEIAVKKTLERLNGAYALIIIKKDSSKMIAARKGSPLILGIGNNEFFLASDIPAFIEHTQNIVFIEDNEIVVIDKNFNIYNFLEGKKIRREIKKIDWGYEQMEKGDFEHYMLKEIHEQPKSLINTLNGRIINNKVFFEELEFNNNYLTNINRIIIVACGTAYYAGLIGKFMIESLSKLSVEVDYASEFRYRNPVITKKDLVIAVSQSGETADTLAAIREARSKEAKVLSICNVIGSSITRESDWVLYTRAGPEIGVASTKAFTSQLGVLYLLAVYLAQIYKTWPEDHLFERIDYIKKIPIQMEILLGKKDEIIEIAEKYFKKSNALYLGRGTNYPVALEGALKLKEISYIHAEGCPASEIKHGPIALIDDQMPVVVIAVKDDTYPKIIGNIQEIKSRKGLIITIASEGDEEIKKISDNVIYVPRTSGLLYPFLTVIPLQLLAYYIANKKGCDIDKPRNLAKSVTVE